MRKVFFGELRAAEFEHLMERSWYAMTETCLAFTVFRDDFSPKFVALFTVLLFLKSFHWLAEDRVDYMERSPVISWLFHLRVLSLLTMLGALDLHLVGHAYQSTITKGASVQLVFGFEYAILLTIIVNIAIKYVLHTIDLNSENPWENKAVFLLYTELIMGFIKVVLYVMFLAIMIRISMLPLFAFRPMYYTMRAFKKAFNDVILSRRAIRNMNTLYPDATPEELAAADNVCIICREEMVTASKKLPCNHIFHTSCLRSWFQRQQTCPTCRLNILRTTPPTQPAREPQAGPQDVLANAADARPPQAFQRPMFFFTWPPQQPRQHQQQQQQPQQQASTGEDQTARPGTSSTTTSGSSNSTTSSPPGMNFPFFCPPFPFMPFSVPPPMPPPDFSGLSEGDLRKMEEVGRAGIEARLQCLRNIQLLLDTSVVMMQQYAASAAVASSSGGSLQPERKTVPTSMDANQSSHTSATTDTAVTGNSDTSSSSSGDQRDDGSKEGAVGYSSKDDESNMVNRPNLTPELEEARRRRLQKFGQTTSD